MIRLATTEDFDLIYELWKNNKDTLWIPYRKEITKYIENQEMYLLFNEDEFIGMCGYAYQKKSNTYWLIALCIKEKYRGQGYGTLLTTHIINVIDKLDSNKLIGNTDKRIFASAVLGADNNKFYNKFSVVNNFNFKKTNTYIIYQIDKDKLRELNGKTR